MSREKERTSVYAKSVVSILAGSGGVNSMVPEAPKDGPALSCQIFKISSLTLDDRRQVLYIAETTKIFRTLELTGRKRMLTLTNSPPLLGLTEKAPGGSSCLCYDAAFDAIYLSNGLDAGRRINKDDHEGDFAIRPLRAYKTPTGTNFIGYRFTTDINGNIYAIMKGDIRIIHYSIDRAEYSVIEPNKTFAYTAEAHKLSFEDIKFCIVRNCIFGLAGPAVWRIDLDGTVNLYAGSLEGGHRDGPLLEARFGVDDQSEVAARVTGSDVDKAKIAASGPRYFCLDDFGRMYLSDQHNCCIRVIDERGFVHSIGRPYRFDHTSAVKTPWKDGLGATAVFTHWLGDITVTPEGTTLYVADNLAYRIRQVDLPKMTMDFARPRRESLIGPASSSSSSSSTSTDVIRLRRTKSEELMTASQIAAAAETDASDCIVS